MAIAQSVIAVEYNGQSTFYNTLPEAIQNAPADAKIYLPGGILNFTEIVVDKPISIIGAGHYPDSTTATEPTLLIGSLKLINGADNFSIAGVRIAGNIVIGDNYSTISNITNGEISRCWINGQVVFPGSELGSSYSNIIIHENAIYHLTPNLGLMEMNNILISNNILGYLSTNQSSLRATINNNVIATFPCFIWQSSFYNNIVFGSVGCGDNVFQNYSSVRNNIFDSNVITSGDPTTIFQNNLTGQLPESIFENYNSGFLVSITNYYLYDLHLKSTSPGKNYGTDGTDVGIYGGAFPWKEGSLPYNPHIQFKNISSATNAQGNLNVEIRAAAQDH